MKLSKIIPRRMETIKFNWCKKDFMKMSDKYRDIREKYRKEKRDSHKCFWCHHKFINGEMMALAQPTKGTNKLLCQVCAEQLN